MKSISLYYPLQMCNTMSIKFNAFEFIEFLSHLQRVIERDWLHFKFPLPLISSLFPYIAIHCGRERGLDVEEYPSTFSLFYSSHLPHSLLTIIFSFHHNFYNRYASSIQSGCMKPNMIFYERRHEIIAMIEPLLQYREKHRRKNNEKQMKNRNR